MGNGSDLDEAISSIEDRLEVLEDLFATVRDLAVQYRKALSEIGPEKEAQTMGLYLNTLGQEIEAAECDEHGDRKIYMRKTWAMHESTRQYRIEHLRKVEAKEAEREAERRALSAAEGGAR